MTMNNNVVMISRHRQWRAWQFGVRHGGLWRGGGSANGNDDPEWFKRMPWWQKLLVVLCTSAVMIFVFMWLPGLFILLAIFGWIMILAK